jgi:glycosyltransferase involved in cell wall biosynthesis
VRAYEEERVRDLHGAPAQIADTKGNGPAALTAVAPLVSLLVPAYNEAAVAEANLTALCDYMSTLEPRFRWELIVVDDGSTDSTGAILERFAASHDNVLLLRHQTNFGLGQALKYGFKRARGDIIVTLDIDLSYSPDHIELMLAKMIATHARVVVASPYMRGGRISDIPWHRRVLSSWANRFLSAAAEGNLATLTGMVRAYDGEFIRSLNLRATGPDINSQIIHQALIMQAHIEEVPAHLDWRPILRAGKRRRSSLKLVQHATAVMLSGFLFRPVVFFIAPGLLALGLSLFAGFWATVHTLQQYQLLSRIGDHDITDAVAGAFRAGPHTFVLGGIALMVAIQLIGLGILSLQSKHYFEEMFYLGVSMQRRLRRNGESK